MDFRRRLSRAAALGRSLVTTYGLVQTRRISIARLSRAEAEQRANTLDGWTLEGDAVRKQYTFASFPDAIAFVNRLAPKAEAADHHPDILINYKRVTLTYSTHSEGGLTEKDFAEAAMADRLT